MEAANSGIKVIVCITEGIPVKDMIKAKDYIKGFDCRLIGPNCPGIITADEAKVGIMPGFVFKKGNIGIVSKSGTLTYEAADQVSKVVWYYYRHRNRWRSNYWYYNKRSGRTFNER